MRFRIWVKRLHLYLALLAALPLLVASLTGAALVYFKPTEYMLNRSVIDLEAGAQRLPLQTMRDRLKTEYPSTTFVGVSVPRSDQRAWQFWGTPDGETYVTVYMNPYTGAMTRARSTAEFSLSNIVRWMTELHYSLFAGEVGSTIVGVCTLMLMGLAISGLILWAPRQWKGLGFRLQLKVAKRWKQNAFNWHSTLGFYSSIALLLIGLTGISMAFRTQVHGLVYFLTGTKARPPVPEVLPIAGQPMMDLDALLTIARQHVKETYGREPWPDYLSFPNDKSAVANFYLQESDELWDLTQYWIAVNANDGKILLSRAPQNLNRGEQVLAWALAFHFGSFGDLGGPVGGHSSRVLWIFAALMPTFLAISGLTIWRKPAWYRHWRDRRKSRA